MDSLGIAVKRAECYELPIKVTPQGKFSFSVFVVKSEWNGFTELCGTDAQGAEARVIVTAPNATAFKFLQMLGGDDTLKISVIRASPSMAQVLIAFAEHCKAEAEKNAPAPSAGDAAEKAAEKR